MQKNNLTVVPVSATESRIQLTGPGIPYPCIFKTPGEAGGDWLRFQEHICARLSHSDRS